MSYINVVSETPVCRSEARILRELSAEFTDSYGLLCVRDPDLACQLLKYESTNLGEFYTRPVRDTSRPNEVTIRIAGQDMKETAA
jgi:hypothetical protein